MPEEISYSMDDVFSSDEYHPPRILVHAEGGVGKTKFGATWETPFFMRTEEGAEELVPKVGTLPMVSSYADFVAQTNFLLDAQHPFKTLVVDTVDKLAPFVHSEVVRLYAHQNERKDGHVPTTIEEFGWGLGRQLADNVWAEVLAGFDALVYKRDMAIVLLTHSDVMRHDPPGSEGYDRYVPRLEKRARALVHEWAKGTLFLNYRTSAKKEKGAFGAEKVKVSGGGERVIYTETRPSHIAKNRWDLDYEIYIGRDKTWSAFHTALHNATGQKYPLPGPIREAMEKSAAKTTKTDKIIKT